MLDENTLIALKRYVEQQGILEILESSSITYNKLITNEALDDFIMDNQQPEFREVLFRFIDEKATTDATIYKKAWMDRRHFSKIRSNPNYNIGKNAVIALVMALELTEIEAEALLQAAGYALSENNKQDLVTNFA